MRTHRFGRKIKLPATIVIKHQLRKLMFEDAVKPAECVSALRGARPTHRNGDTGYRGGPCEIRHSRAPSSKF